MCMIYQDDFKKKLLKYTARIIVGVFGMFLFVYIVAYIFGFI